MRNRNPFSTFLHPIKNHSQTFDSDMMKTRRKILQIASISPLLASGVGSLLYAAQTNDSRKVGPDESTPPDTQWFTDARFGMFIHFGLYSIPAGVWKGQRMGRNWYAEWIRTQHNFPNQPVGIPRKEYDTLLEQFNPVNFDADAWIAEAKNAGMKYFLITAKHHDGFALWPSKASKYNVVDATPFKRDILGELKQACVKHGLRLGFYYSHWQDWGHPGGAMPPWDGRHRLNPAIITQPSPDAFANYWRSIVLPQVQELIDGYDPAFFWFDTWNGVNKEQITEQRIDELIALVRSKSPHCLINSRIGSTWCHSKGDQVVDYLSMGDNQFPGGLISRPWETSGTMNRSWGHHSLDHQWKPTSQFLHHLIDNVSRGGNYQLNVGPKADGSFPRQAIKRLRELGAWMLVNGESIHGASPAPLPEPTWGRITMRTQTDGRVRLYLHVYNWSKDAPVVIKGHKTRPREAFVLETGEKVETAQTDEGAIVKLPKHQPDQHVSVVAVDLPGRDI